MELAGRYYNLLSAMRELLAKVGRGSGLDLCSSCSHALNELEDRPIPPDQALDLAHGVDDGDMVPTTERLEDVPACRRQKP